MSIATPVHVVSLGAGVQSSALCFMAALGEIVPMPVAAIFADTGSEPSEVYDWVDWMSERLPFPVLRVKRGGDSLEKFGCRMKTMPDGRKFPKCYIPWFTRGADGATGMVTRRSCTKEYKIRPVQKAARRVSGITRGQTEVGCVQWIGLSREEVWRVKDSRVGWQRNRWPLIEMDMSRANCLFWMESHGYPRPPRSACVFCPFRSDSEWRYLAARAPSDFRRAVEFETAANAARRSDFDRQSRLFLHPAKRVRNCWRISLPGMC